MTAPAPVTQTTPTGDGSTSATETLELDQAQRLESILADSSRARRLIARASAQLPCSADYRDLQAGLRIRRQMQVDLKGTDLSALSEEPEIRRLISSFLTASIRADLHYLRQFERGGCADDTELQCGNAYSATATAEKRRFAAEWNQLAKRLGLSSVSDTDI